MLRTKIPNGRNVGSLSLVVVALLTFGFLLQEPLGDVLRSISTKVNQQWVWATSETPVEWRGKRLQPACLWASQDVGAELSERKPEDPYWFEASHKLKANLKNTVESQPKPVGTHAYKITLHRPVQKVEFGDLGSFEWKIEYFDCTDLDVAFAWFDSFI